jgi:hypothetical protein
MRTGLHEGTSERVVDVDMTVNITDDDFPLAIINTACTDLFATNIVMTAREAGRERERERQVERER